MNVSVTFFFEGYQLGTLGTGSAVGWTETWYGKLPDDLLTLDAVFEDGDVQNYIRLRKLCLPNIYRMTFIRVAEVADVSRRRVKIFNLTNAVGALPSTRGSGEPSQVQCALLVDMVRLGTESNGINSHRRFLMRGLPMSIIDGNVLYRAGAYWENFVNFLNFVSNRDSGTAHPAGTPRARYLGLRYIEPNSIWAPIPQVSVSAFDNRLITVQGTFSAPVGTTYRFKGFSGFTDLQWLNRTWTVVDVNSGSAPFATFGKLRKGVKQGSNPPLYTPPGLAQLRRIIWAYATFSQYTVIGLRSRRTGRVFRQLLGRSRRRT